jgi:hypothetical protein
MIEYDVLDEEDDDEEDEDDEELDETDDGGVVELDLLKFKLFFKLICNLSLLICGFSSAFKLGYKDLPHKSNNK